MFVIPPFALMQKVEPKMEANPNGSACFAGQPTATVFTAFVFSLLRSKQLVSFCLATFSKPHALPSGVTYCRRCIPLPFS
jgi:hypothetical protein